MDGERASVNPVLSALVDDDDCISTTTLYIQNRYHKVLFIAKLYKIKTFLPKIKLQHFCNQQ